MAPPEHECIRPRHDAFFLSLFLATISLVSFRHGGASRGVEYNIRKKDKNNLYGFRFFKVTSSQKTVEDISFLPFYLAREDSPSRVRSGLHTEPLKLISCYKKRRKLFFGSFISIERSVQKSRTENANSFLLRAKFHR